MAYDLKLAQRIQHILKNKKIPFEEKKMMGGLCFMVREKMCIGVHEDRTMARVGPDQYVEALRAPGAREMDFTGRPMRGFVFVDPIGTKNEKSLIEWVERCLVFNPKATSSKKKTKKTGSKKFR